LAPLETAVTMKITIGMKTIQAHSCAFASSIQNKIPL
jgi:hypothetical protein